MSCTVSLVLCVEDSLTHFKIPVF